MWNKISPALLHQVNRMPERCTVNLEKKPRSSIQASLLAARTLAHNSHLTAGALGSIREEKKLLGSGESQRQQACHCFAVMLCESLCITQLSPNHSARGKAALTSSDRYARWECSVHWAMSGGVGSCQHLFSFTCKPQCGPTIPRGGHSVTPRAEWEIWLSETNGAFFRNMVTCMHT